MGTVIRGRRTRAAVVATAGAAASAAILASALALSAFLAAAVVPIRAQDASEDGHKKSCLIQLSKKAHFDDEDRDIIRRYLEKRRDELQPAPREVAGPIFEQERWSEAGAQYGRDLPPKLSKRLGDAPEGTFRVIFDRSILLVWAETGRILDRVTLD